MNLSELKQKPIGELLDIAKELGLENLARTRKQDVIFSILKRAAKNGSDIYGDGVLEILQDGFGFLRSAEGSYLAGPDDIYVSPSQIRRFNLRTGDTIAGKIRPPKDGERYFAMLKVNDFSPVTGLSCPAGAPARALAGCVPRDTQLRRQEHLATQVGEAEGEHGVAALRGRELAQHHAVAVAVARGHQAVVVSACWCRRGAESG